MNVSLQIASRISLNRKGKGKSPAIYVAVIATALSLAVMLAAVAIVGGFKREIREKVVGFNSDMILYVPATAENADEANLLTITPSLQKILDEEPYITGYYQESSIPAIFKTDEDFKGIYFKGLSRDADRSFLQSSLTEGHLPNYDAPESEIAISDIMAKTLKLKPGQSIDTYFICNDIKARKLKISGIYNSHFDAYDDLYAYGDIKLVNEIVGLKENQASSLHISTADFNNLNYDTDQLNRRLALALAQGEIYKPLVVTNALTQGASYFRWLDLLDTNVVVILTLMIIVACITLISGMLIIILDKRSLIGLLKTLGASNRLIRRVFIIIALRVAAIGMAVGDVLMIILLWIQAKWRIIPLEPDSYYLDFVPVRLDMGEILILNAGVLLLILLSLILPSQFASRIPPAETIKTE